MKRARIKKIDYTYEGKTEDRWLVLWTDLKGDRREKRFHNKRHAEAFATKTDKEVADNIHVADRGTITFKQAAEDYLQWIDKRHNARDRDIAGSTRHGYALEMRKHIIPHFGHRKLNQIKSVDVQRFIDEQAQKYGRGYVTKFYRRIKSVLKHAVNNELGLARNPLDDRPAKIPGKDARRADIPGYEEVRKLFRD
jgi:integrase